jgi:hypothetical protein
MRCQNPLIVCRTITLFFKHFRYPRMHKPLSFRHATEGSKEESLSPAIDSNSTFLPRLTTFP